MTGLVACLGLATLAGASARLDDDTAGANTLAMTAVAERIDQAETASRGNARQAQPNAVQKAAAEKVAAQKAAAQRKAAAQKAAAQKAAAQKVAAQKAAAKKAAAAKKVAPVAGLDQVQMDNAKAIVDAGKKLGLPKRAWVIALATAMQESNLYNLASTVIPESQRYTNQGSGSDHDSVGLFQQRSSTGWGAVKDLMKPAFAATQFYQVLRTVPNWDTMPLTAAAQTVQVSAFPDAYAKHESRATSVANALS